MHIRHTKKHVSKQLWSNTQLSSTDGLKEKMYITIKTEKMVSMCTLVNPTIETSYELWLLKKRPSILH